MDHEWSTLEYGVTQMPWLWLWWLWWCWCFVCLEKTSSESESPEFWVTQTIPGIPVLQKLMFVICDPSLGKQPSHHITSHHMQFQFRVIVILGFLGKQLVCANCAFTVHSEGKHNITHQVINFWNLEYVSMWDETWDMRHESWVMNRDSDDMRNFFQCPVTLWLWPDPVSRPMMVLTVLTAHPIPIN